MGTINIMNKYHIFSDSIFSLLYWVPTIIFLFIGASLIESGFREHKTTNRIRTGKKALIINKGLST